MLSVSQTPVFGLAASCKRAANAIAHDMERQSFTPLTHFLEEDILCETTLFGGGGTAMPRDVLSLTLGDEVEQVIPMVVPRLLTRSSMAPVPEPRAAMPETLYFGVLEVTGSAQLKISLGDDPMRASFSGRAWGLASHPNGPRHRRNRCSASAYRSTRTSSNLLARRKGANGW